MKAPDISVLQSWSDAADESSRKKRWQWFVIDQFLRGNHSVRGNPNDNTIVVTQKSEAINYPINRIFSTFRAVRAFVTRHKPYVEVEPKDSSPESKDYARRSNRILERDNQLNNFAHINKEWVYFGVKYGVGYRQVGYDPVKQCAIRWTVDPFDLRLGSKTGIFEDCPYVDKTVIRSVGYLRNKYKKKKDMISPDNELAADEYKKLSLQIEYQDDGLNAITEDEQTKIVHETWYRIFTPNKQGGYINKCIWIDTGILDFEETPLTDYPFIPYYSDITPGELFPEGHLKHIISPQRMFNLLNTHLLEYNHIVNRGRFLKDKNAGFRVINTKEGQIIERNKGAQVQVLPIPALNPMLQYQLDLALESIEDIGGQHDASLGSTPERVSSGAAIESLQTGDSNNISDLRDNFEDSLAKEAAMILKMYSIFEKNGLTLNSMVDDQEEEQFTVMGAEAYSRMGKDVPKQYFIEETTYSDVCAVLPDNNVKVSVSSQLGETRQARMDLLMRLVELGLPLKVLIDHLEFPNSSDIMERIAEEALADIQMEQMKMMATQPPMGPEGAMPPQGPPPAAPSVPEAPTADSEKMQAIAELKQLRNKASKIVES